MIKIVYKLNGPTNIRLANDVSTSTILFAIYIYAAHRVFNRVCMSRIECLKKREDEAFNRSYNRIFELPSSMLSGKQGRRCRRQFAKALRAKLTFLTLTELGFGPG